MPGNIFRASAKLSVILQKVSVFPMPRFKLTEFIIHKADIERGVMDHQLRAADVIHKLITTSAKVGLSSRNSSAIPCTPNASGSTSPIGLQIDVKIVTGQAAVDHLHGAILNDLVSFVVCPIWFIPVVSVSRTIWRVIAVLIAVIYVRLIVYKSISITGSLPEMLKQVENFHRRLLPG
ncbi:ribonuclease H [Klebsiella pneumoniae]|uniref:Ribonuclease H n=1 Tax=Klebsiella pneumoniae TaxID=573 RepID=A0A4P0XV41_KLEPN|nr:ribonuclease H [Klebsiella pneumoniae]